MKIKFLTLIFSLQSACLLAQKKAVFTIQADRPGAAVASTMWGIFFEDINMGADGGLYAELVKNRSFEFSKPLMGWTINSDKIKWGFNFGSDILIINQSGKEATNPRFMRITLNNNTKGTLGSTNEGFRGMGIKKGLRYDFSVLYRQKTAKAKLYLELATEKGDIIGSGIYTPDQTDDDWHKGEMSFTATATDAKAKLNIWFEGTGILDLDMISLFPGDTWKGQKAACVLIWFRCLLI